MGEPENPCKEEDIMCAQPTDEIKNLRKQYMVAQDAGDVDGCVSFWSDDGVLMPPNEPSVTGKEALRAWYQDAFNQFGFQFSIEYQQVEEAGDWAFARGRYSGSIIPKTGGDPIQDTGKLLEVLRRQPDGSWKWACHMWSSDNPH